MAKKHKTWREKLHNSKGLPKIERIAENMSKRWGEGTLAIPAPLEIYEMMSRVPCGRLITVSELREAVAKKHGTTIGCPLTTGIFVWVSAHAAEEESSTGERELIPYWRTLKSKGQLNEKYPGGAERQKGLLEKEGHRIIKKGRNFYVADYLLALCKVSDLIG